MGLQDRLWQQRVSQIKDTLQEQAELDAWLRNILHRIISQAIQSHDCERFIWNSDAFSILSFGSREAGYALPSSDFDYVVLLKLGSNTAQAALEMQLDDGLPTHPFCRISIYACMHMHAYASSCLQPCGNMVEMVASWCTMRYAVQYLPRSTEQDPSNRNG